MLLLIFCISYTSIILDVHIKQGQSVKQSEATEPPSTCCSDFVCQSEKSCPKGAKGAKTVCDIQLVNLDVSPTVQAQD